MPGTFPKGSVCFKVRYFHTPNFSKRPSKNTAEGTYARMGDFRALDIEGRRSARRHVLHRQEALLHLRTCADRQKPVPA